MTDAPKDPLASLDEVLTTLQWLEEVVLTMEFDCDNPLSVKAALQATDAVIDKRMAAYRGHALVESTIAELKAECRANILAQVETANLRRGTRALH
ncbi:MULTISPECIES: hypothetical protein [Burkholderiaceae]|uniref:Uncharacterized protein n=1 Tax=Caballeronia sordidicola TaxID=196367 RepID=A0A242MYD8_CABSO|nr:MULTISPECIES: hypothetical protein [Burkholderiaceae]AME28188.1 hypothetical protein AXG89_30555 [Burkholderia sp. PAMC 26561]OTP75906.1 hypothetical protein PAMC26577_12125 [Caballeronia sordidicola]